MLRMKSYTFLLSHMAITLKSKQSEFFICYELFTLTFSSTKLQMHITFFFSFRSTSTCIKRHVIPAKQPTTIGPNKNISKISFRSHY